MSGTSWVPSEMTGSKRCPAGELQRRRDSGEPLHWTSILGSFLSPHLSEGVTTAADTAWRVHSTRFHVFSSTLGGTPLTRTSRYPLGQPPRTTNDATAA